MYTSFFGLNEKPFSITPDPRYLFLSERHGEALAHLVYGVTESGGFMQLTGEVGTGKTTLVRTLLQNRLPENADVAVVLNPQLSVAEFLQTIGEELGVTQPENGLSIKAMTDALNRHLLRAHAEGRRTILVVDEAQNLSRDVLEQVRLLTNLETSKQKLLQIVLIGQPELRDLLARNDLRQLAQRITGRYHLEPLSREDTAAYVEHRLRVAGALTEIFEPAAKKEVFRLSGGVPRLINVICDRALLGAYGQEARRVSRRLVRQAAAEISGTPATSVWARWGLPVMAIAAAGLIGFGSWSWYTAGPPPAAQAEAAQSAPAPAMPATARPEAAAAAPEDDSGTLAADPGNGIATPEADDAGPAADADDGPAGTLDEELRLAAGLTDELGAFTSLFALWGLPPPTTPDPCDSARAAGYECLEQRGSWNSLRQYDRPAVLTLTDREGAAHQVVLEAINGEQAILSLGGVEVEHSIADVSALWFGRYRLLWRPPNGSAASLVPGVEDPNVVWLRQSLASIDDRYRADPLESDFYDEELAARVRDFQRDNRLIVDGLAGRQTQIVINSLVASGEVPRLATSRLAQD
jgi:general secretion pathway protein A